MRWPGKRSVVGGGGFLAVVAVLAIWAPHWAAELTPGLFTDEDWYVERPAIRGEVLKDCPPLFSYRQPSRECQKAQAAESRFPAQGQGPKIQWFEPTASGQPSMH
jgi:hypothetical protein